MACRAAVEAYDINYDVMKEPYVALSYLRENKRDMHHVVPRQIAMYLMREVLHFKYEVISSILFRTHASAMHGVKTIKNEMEYNKDLRRMVSLEKSLLKESVASSSYYGILED